MVERPSVRLSVCQSQRARAALVCGGFAAERPVDRKYQSIAAGALWVPICAVQLEARRAAGAGAPAPLSSKCGASSR